jgi:hypothetical protein
MALAALIVGIIALLIAIPVIGQMVWGKPELTISFGSSEVDGGKIMCCELFNYPIKSRFRTRIGIRRMPIEDLMADFSIAEYGSGKVIYPGCVPHILRYDGRVNAQRIELPASIFPAHFGVAVVSYDAKGVKVYDESVGLPVGKYVVKVRANLQEKDEEAEGILVVQREHPYAYWS